MTARYWNISYLLVLAVLALSVAYTFSKYGYDIQGGVLVFIGLCLVSFWMIKKMARAEEGQWFLVVLVSSFFLRILASIARLQTNEIFYGGQLDAALYSGGGRQVAEGIVHLDFSFVAFLAQFQGGWGTRYTQIYSGLVHLVTGPSLYGSFIMFGVLSFIGLYLYYRAFCIAFPHGNRKLYAVLVFMLPSLLFWPNGLGKDALMTLFMGFMAYGAARVFIGEYSKSLIPLCIGIWGTFTVRPHMTGIIVMAMVAAMLLGGGKVLSKSPILYVATVGVILIAGWYLVPVGLEYSGLSGGSLDDLQSYIDLRQVQTGHGGSGFTFPSITNPLNFPAIALTVIARPYPWEAHNLQAFLQAADGALLLGLMAWKSGRIVQALGSITSKPYVTFILVYTALFIVAFTTVANFGTLARERAMLLPLLLMLIAFLPEPKTSKRSTPSDNSSFAKAKSPPAEPQTL